MNHVQRAGTQILQMLLVVSMSSPFLTPIAAAGLIEEIVVTAQKREQGIQEVGIAITAFSGDQMRELGLTDPDKLDMHVPGLMITGLPSTATSVYTLRGSTQLDFADHHEPPVAVYVDGAYNSFLGAVGQSFFDLDRVEVLKGPQGTLFGRNATGGLVHLVTNQPSQEFDGFIEVGAGEYGMFRAEGGVGGALSDTVSARLSGLFSKNDGFVESLSGGSDLAVTETQNLRLQFLFEPSDDVNFLLSTRYNKDPSSNTIGYHPRSVALNFPELSGADLAAITNGVSELLGIPNDPAIIFPAVGQGDGLIRHATGQDFIDSCSHPLSVGFFAPGGVDCFGVSVGDDDPLTALVDQKGEFEREYWGVTGTLNWNVGEMELVAIFDYQTLDKFYLEDTDSTPIQSLDFFQYADSTQLSAEFRMHWQSESATYVAGAYYLDIDGDFRSGLNLSQGLGFSIDNNYKTKTESYAFFFQGEWNLSPEWTAIAGIRWTEDKKKATLIPGCEWAIFGDPDCSALLLPFLGFAGTSVQELGYDLKRSEGDYSGILELDWHPNDDWLVYGKVTRANKAGAFNAGAVALYTPSQAEFDGEVLTSFEVGFKSTLADGTTRLNVAAFVYDYQDFQTFTQVGPSLVVFNIDAKVKGAEIELVTNPAEGWEFLLGVSLLDAEVQNLSYGAGLVGDVPMTNSPDITLNGMGRYQWSMFGGTAAAQIDFGYVDDRNLNAVPHPALVADAYTVFNARLSFTSASERWQAEIWIENFTDEEYVPTAFDLAAFTGVAVDTYGLPRWVGATFRYYWN